MNLRIAVVGATGAVGRLIVKTLYRRHFPLQSIDLIASRHSKGKILDTDYGSLKVHALEQYDFKGIDIAFFSAGSAVSKVFVPQALSKVRLVIDNTSAFRMDPNIPLIVPEVNGHLLQKGASLIANPNCSTAQMVLALKAIHDFSPIEGVQVTTFQAASGTGQKGVVELIAQTQALLDNRKPPEPKVHARRLAFNCIPQIGEFDDQGYSFEEIKMIQETRKILQLPNLPISATCVRVPVLRGHSEVIHVQTQEPVSRAQAMELFAKAPGLRLIDALQSPNYPTPMDAVDRLETFIGRVREDLSHSRGLVFWNTSDNLLKGAAWNAVQIAEHCLQYF